jgi:DCN1-like protein 4/5
MEVEQLFVTMSVSKSKNSKRHVLEDVDWMSERKRRRKDSVSSKKMSSLSGRSSSSNKADGFAKARCMSWFDHYKCQHSDEQVIGPEGIERFCSDLGVNPEDSVMLVIAWTLDAHQMGYFTRSEWFSGMEKLG